MSKDPLVYKHMSADLPDSAREETLTVLSDLVVDQDADYRSFTTQRTWADRRLSAIYGIQAPNLRVWLGELPQESGRRGFLGQVGFRYQCARCLEFGDPRGFL